MSKKYFPSAVAAVALSTCALSVHAYDNTGHNWMPKQPANPYWQAPDWSGVNFPSDYRSPPPAYKPPPRPDYRRPYPPQNYPAPGVNRPQANQPPATRPAPPAMNPNRGYPPPRGPYAGSYRPDSGASAFNMPGYNRYRNNRRSNSKFWGRSGPSTWMRPNKRNWEQGWDDMINSPSRMGEMPGGWTAPEVTMPNPIDMGDQMQDNVKDLPEQMKDMNVGNEVE